MLQRVVDGLSLLVVSFLAFLCLHDLVSYFRRPSDYVFGSEVAGFKYATPTYFMGTITVSLLLAVMAFAAPRVFGEGWPATLGRATVATILLVGSLTLSSKG